MQPLFFMTMDAFDPLHHKARDIAQHVAAGGGRALLVGGYVRDRLLGLEPKDADIEVYGIEPEPLLKLLRRSGRVDCVGESYRVYKLVWHAKAHLGQPSQRHELDVSLPRRDKKVAAGHRGFVVEGDPHSSIEDAARRRDFTINAILQDPLTEEVLDPVGGRADLERRVLRAVDANHFGEDSLRVLRAVQFAARFEMTPDAATVALCRGIALDDLPKERIWGEFEKLLLKAERPSLGLILGTDLQVWEQIMPELQRGLDLRGDAMRATLDRAAGLRGGLPHEKQVALMLAAVASFIGWRGTKLWLDRLGLFTLRGYDVRRTVILLAGERNRVGRWFRRRAILPDRELRLLGARVDARLLHLLTLARGEEEAAAWFIAKMEELGAADGPPAPLLMGRHLLEMGLAPGPRVGEITRAVYYQQLCGEITDLDSALEVARKLMAEATNKP